MPGIALRLADLKLWNTEGLAMGKDASVLVSRLSGNGFGRLTDVVIVVAEPCWHWLPDSELVLPPCDITMTDADEEDCGWVLLSGNGCTIIGSIGETFRPEAILGMHKVALAVALLVLAGITLVGSVTQTASAFTDDCTDCCETVGVATCSIMLVTHGFVSNEQLLTGAAGIP